MRIHIFFARIVLALFLSLFTLTKTVRAQADAGRSMEGESVPGSCSNSDATSITLRQLEVLYRPSVLWLSGAVDENGNSVALDKPGTGFIISRDGFVLTAAHVAKKKDGTPINQIVGKFFDIRGKQEFVLDRQPASVGADVALFKLADTGQSWHSIPLNLPPRAVMETEMEDHLNVLGFDVQTSWASHEGSLKNKSVPGGYWATNLPITFGYSGSPVFNDKGLVIGIAESGTSDIPGVPPAASLVVPINYALSLIGQAGVKISSPATEKLSCLKPIVFRRPQCDPCGVGSLTDGAICGGEYIQFWKDVLRQRGLDSGTDLTELGHNILNFRAVRMMMKCTVQVNLVMLEGDNPPPLPGEGTPQYQQRMVTLRQQVKTDSQRLQGELSSIEQSLGALHDVRLSEDDPAWLSQDSFKNRYPECCSLLMWQRSMLRAPVIDAKSD